MKIQFIFLTVVFGLTSFILRAEPSVHEGDTTTEIQKVRSEADIRLTEKATKFIAFRFWTPSNVIQEKYGKSIPSAMDKAITGNDSEIVPIVSKLMGTINPDQIQALVLSAASDRKEEISKLPRDDRYIALLDRFIWAGLKIEPSLMNRITEEQKEELDLISKTDKANAFSSVFEKNFEEIKKQNDITLEKIKQAADGIPSAIEWVKNNLEQRSLLRWAEGQKKNGNSLAAERLVSALSLKVGGQKVLDMTKPGESQRIELGNTKESLARALDSFFRAPQNGFGDSMVSYSPLIGAINKNWSFDATGKFHDEPVENKPPSPPPTHKVTENPVDSEIKPELKPASPPKTPPLQPVVAQNDNFKKFMALINKRGCQDCHSTTIEGNSFATLKMSRNKKPSINVGKFLGSLSGSMDDVFTESDVELLREWATK